MREALAWTGQKLCLTLLTAGDDDEDVTCCGLGPLFFIGRLPVDEDLDIEPEEDTFLFATRGRQYLLRLLTNQFVNCFIPIPVSAMISAFSCSVGYGCAICSGLIIQFLRYSTVSGGNAADLRPPLGLGIEAVAAALIRSIVAEDMVWFVW